MDIKNVTFGISTVIVNLLVKLERLTNETYNVEVGYINTDNGCDIVYANVNDIDFFTNADGHIIKYRNWRNIVFRPDLVEELKEFKSLVLSDKDVKSDYLDNILDEVLKLVEEV